MSGRALVGGVATLPMYDMPAIAAETDRLWAALRVAIRDRGLRAPDALTRSADHAAAWRAPDLVLSQTCGLPFVQRLRGHVTLVGAPDFGLAADLLPGCPPGYYASVIVARADDARDGFAAFRGATLALNGRDSQSGYAAPMAATAPLAQHGRFFGAGLETGGHLASIRAVAEGRADFAAIDAVTWRLATRHEPAAARLRVVATTEPTPGLPYIAAAGAGTAKLADACAEAIAGLDAPARAALGLVGFARLSDADYDPLAERLARAEAAHRLP